MSTDKTVQKTAGEIAVSYVESGLGVSHFLVYCKMLMVVDKVFNKYRFILLSSYVVT